MAVFQLNCSNMKVVCCLQWHLVVICHSLLQDMWVIPIENSDSVIRGDPAVNFALGWTLGMHKKSHLA